MPAYSFKTIFRKGHQGTSVEQTRLLSAEVVSASWQTQAGPGANRGPVG